MGMGKEDGEPVTLFTQEKKRTDRRERPPTQTGVGMGMGMSKGGGKPATLFK